MFVHNFNYALKTLFRNKSLIFWTFAFPIILATFFTMAFSNITESEKLNIIDIAIINDIEFNNNEVFQKSFESLSDKENEDRLFEIIYTTEEEAKELLAKDEVIGYMKLVNDEPKIVFNTSGINQTIFKYISEEVTQTSNIIKNLSEEEIKKEIMSGNISIDTEAIYKEIEKIMAENHVKLKNISSNNLDYVMIEFYTLIAMSCMYGGILGMVAINQSLANMSKSGKRMSVAPIKKWMVILSSLLASYLAQIVGLAILFIYTIFALKVDYGSHIVLVILLACIGSFAGLAMGVGLGTLLKTNDNTKTGILIATTMFGCFLSGMFGITMKYIIDKNIPLINKLNPVNMITDGLYSLYYYDTLNRYWFNVISLLLFAFVFILLSFVGLRRQKYDSI